MSLNIMIAGCSKDERERIDQAVRAAFTGRPDDEPWNVSLVNVANQWSIDIDGPEPQFKGMSLIAPTDELTASLKDALGGAPEAPPSANGNGQAPAPPEAPSPSAPAPVAAAPAPIPATPAAPPPAPTPGGARADRHECEECAATFEVVFEQESGESEELCPVACPACWHVNRVPIAEHAGATGDYRAQVVT